MRTAGRSFSSAFARQPRRAASSALRGKDETTVISASGATSPDPVAYDYQSHGREVLSSAKISWSTVRKAVHGYVAAGGARPDGVSWKTPS
ncbi:Imm1 family immunity protein [Amycolatopsis japonica]|uniref:Imm1 family immunity protein n=1 Tax=Amycolatopsis japonica TaxID=208439 RepID=UPI0038163BC6